jgi:hypothetical protein
MKARPRPRPLPIAQTLLVAGLSVTTLLAPRIARADDRDAAITTLASLDPAWKDDAIVQAKDSLERATRMHNAGDPSHARLAEALALEWARLARDRARALAAEKSATDAQVADIEAAARVEREQSLLEEAITRSGRLKAELATLTAKEHGATHPDHTKTFAPRESTPRGKGPPPAHGASHASHAGGASPGEASPRTDADAPADHPPAAPAHP